MENKQLKRVDYKVDILVAGGGIAGLTAAVSAKEKNPDAQVLILEKQTAGYGGKANKGGACSSILISTPSLPKTLFATMPTVWVAIWAIRT